jgi:hypothetical protein
VTFEDLPDNWDDRPLTDPALLSDVLDWWCSRRTGPLVR